MTLVRLRTPRFAEAQAANRWGLLVLALLWAGQFVVAPSARSYLGWTLVVLLLWLLTRVYTLSRIEQRQRLYEQQWLAAQTAVLRDTWFEVVRFTAHRRYGPDLDRWDESKYELTCSHDVRELLARQESERGAGPSSKVTIEFTFPLPECQYAALALAHADLAGIETVVTGRRSRSGGVRFPHAAYHAAAPHGRRDRARPSRSTFWVLGVPVLSMAAPDTASATQADSSVGAR
ncbi:hypothetical protein AB0I52_15995 [Streptomyces sp. NPDC050423]|uniref:hypothetical protein n=1 Tax=Streptomyces sp. NPDC050423 TaxID=3155402 RepID=UPI00343FFCF6